MRPSIHIAGLLQNPMRWLLHAAPPGAMPGESRNSLLQQHTGLVLVPLNPSSYRHDCQDADHNQCS